MDPSDAELNNINSLAEVKDWAGLEDGLHNKLIADLGTPTKLRDLAFMARQTWDSRWRSEG